jgi:hypothetical protein
MRNDEIREIQREERERTIAEINHLPLPEQARDDILAVCAIIQEAVNDLVQHTRLVPADPKAKGGAINLCVQFGDGRSGHGLICVGNPRPFPHRQVLSKTCGKNSHISHRVHDPNTLEQTAEGTKLTAHVDAAFSQAIFDTYRVYSTGATATK